MARVPIDSSVIQEVEWHRGKLLDPSEMTVWFRDGDVRTYIDVPHDIYQQMIKASSPGAYFNQNIRGVYHERKGQ